MTIRFRTFRALHLALLMACFVVSPRTSSGQNQFLSMAPLNKVLQFSSGSEIDATNMLIGIERSMPIGALLPQVTPDSYLDFMRIAAGVNLQDSKVRMRGRATAVGFEIQKMPWAATLSVVDFDASGYHSFSADWLALGIGPGLDAGDRMFRISGRVIGVASFNSMRFGSEILRFPTRVGDKTRQSIRYGFRSTVSVDIEERFLLLGKYTMNNYSIDQDIQVTSLLVSIRVKVVPTLSVMAAYEQLTYTLRESELDLDGVRLGLLLSPAVPQ